MATTPPTSISGSYQRLSGPTPVITQGTPGPELSAATRERLRLAEDRKLDEEKRAAEMRRLQGLTPLQRSGEEAKRYEEELRKNKELFDRMNSAKGPYAGRVPYKPNPDDFSQPFKGI